MVIDNCRHCHKTPQLKQFGELYDIWCESPDRECYPGAWVSCSSKIAAVEEWNTIHGEATNAQKNDE